MVWPLNGYLQKNKRLSWLNFATEDLDVSKTLKFKVLKRYMMNIPPLHILYVKDTKVCLFALKAVPLKQWDDSNL